MNPPSLKLVLLRVVAIIFALGVLSCHVLRRQKAANKAHTAANAATESSPVYSGGTKSAPLLHPDEVTVATGPTRAPGSKFDTVIMANDVFPVFPGEMDKTPGTTTRLFRQDKASASSSDLPKKEEPAEENAIDKLLRETADELSRKSRQPAKAPPVPAAEPGRPSQKP